MSQPLSVADNGAADASRGLAYDLVIRGGRLADGTGAPIRLADVAVRDGRIAAVGAVDGEARRTIDAAGLIVAPGFVDPHTHYDAQVSWDRLLTPSSWHGVTTAIMGNCGIGVAPCRPDPKSRAITLEDLVSVEQIPFEVLNSGVEWSWTTFPEYMDANVRRGLALNTGFIAPLTPFRQYVMGEEAVRRAANADETQAIAGLIRGAMEAGALGFSLTTLANHVGHDGLPVASRLTGRDELAAYCHVLRDLGRGCVEISVSSTGAVGPAELELLEFVVTESGRPVTWLALLDRDDMPTACSDALAATDALAARGARPQVSCRPLTLEVDLTRPGLLTVGMPSMAAFAGRNHDSLVALYSDPAFRAAFREDLESPQLFSGRWDLMTVHRVRDSSLAPLLRRQVADIAIERGQDAVDTFFDLALADDLALAYNYEALNTDEDRVGDLIADARAMIGLSDAGAHVDMLCDASYTTYLLGHWVRETGRLSLEQAVKRLTSEPADFFGLTNRGRIAVGKAADIVIFDAETIGSSRRPAEIRSDLPSGGRRMVTPALGVQHTIVNGRSVFEDGVHSGEYPGQVLRLGSATTEA